jgi:peroxiredoxin (alkyl hydroperoxide reductase subunit C)
MSELEQVHSLPRIGEPAPDFEANTSKGPVRLSQFRGRWVMLFSHPADFTPVCSTEIMEFARRYDEFQARQVDLLGLSVDSVPAHIAWTRSLAQQLGKPIPFPIIADLDMKVSRLYGMIHPQESNTATVRAVFFIDDAGIIRALLYYPLSTGRSVDELLRVFDSLQTTKRLSVSTPVDWKPGDPVVVPAPATADQVEEREEAEKKGLIYRDWYLRFRNPS